MASGAVGSVGSVALWGSFHDLSSQKHVILSGMKWKWYDDLQTDEISFHRISRCFLFRRDLHVLLTPRQRRQLQVESQEASQWIRWLGWWVVQLQVPQNLQRFHTPPDMHSLSRHLGSMLDRYAVSWLSIIEGSHGPTKSGNDGGEFRASWNLQSLIAGFEVKQLSLALSLLDISFCLKWERGKRRGRVGPHLLLLCREVPTIKGQMLLSLFQLPVWHLSTFCRCMWFQYRLGKGHHRIP